MFGKRRYPEWNVTQKMQRWQEWWRISSGKNEPGWRLLSFSTSHHLPAAHLPQKKHQYAHTVACEYWLRLLTFLLPFHSGWVQHVPSHTWRQVTHPPFVSSEHDYVKNTEIKLNFSLKPCKIQIIYMQNVATVFEHKLPSFIWGIFPS